MAVSLTEYLTSIQELTKKNLEILNALNDAFYTKSEHLSVNIDNKPYVIPSFISLENKINTLEDNFENLVNAPRTGEAVFNFNGNTQEIQVKGFSNVPNTAFEGLDMEQVAGIKTFDAVKNSVFKDFLTPTPFIKIGLSTIPDDIQQVNVKKIAVLNPDLVTLLKEASGWVTASASENTQDSVCRPIEYREALKKLYGFTPDVDYVMYDKVYTLPIRYELGNGKYSILAIKNNWTDDNFIEHYTLKLDNLSYRIADETIERNLIAGDYLITNNDKVKLLIESIDFSESVVDVKVENGGFADLCTADDENVDLSTLKFFANGSINKDKYLNIPLEEDDYIMVFLAPIQRNSLIQSAWSNGLFINTANLVDKNGEKYKDYYNRAVTNIGDKLFGIVSMASKDFVNVGEAEFNTITTAKPVIDPEALKVLLINKHVSNSETVQQIYNLYQQKNEYKSQLSTVEKEIASINDILNKNAFDSNNSTRQVYTDQLSGLSSKKKELLSNIANTIQQITIASTDTDTPVENPKYHIRGFFDYEKFIDSLNLVENGANKHNVIKIDVQYRYKNATKATGNAESIGTDIFSDWNKMESFINMKTPAYGYSFKYPENNSNINEPSFNQIDIPISQGESVDIRMRVVYAVGFPFVQTTSDWSEIVNVEFPNELKQNVTVLDIIKENNSDTTKEAFRGYLEKEGVITHVGDSLLDQNITYFHTPDHIASGFYTADTRRVIPLGEKLLELDKTITTIRDEVFGTSSQNIEVTITGNNNSQVINPFVDNIYDLPSIVYEGENSIAEQNLILKITNKSASANLKLFSLFPGNYNNIVTKTNPQSKFTNSEYAEDTLCAPIQIDGAIPEYTPQVQNQWMYFRIADPYDGTPLFTDREPSGGDPLYGKRTGDIVEGNYVWPDFINVSNLYIVPSCKSITDICINETDNPYYKLLAPGESLQINLRTKYSVNSGSTTISKTMIFDLRTSLYSDPNSYKIEFKASYLNTSDYSVNTGTTYTPDNIE